MKTKLNGGQLSIWNILGAMLCAKMFSLLGLFLLKGNTDFSIGTITILSRIVELLLFLWLISAVYQPVKIWLKPILIRHMPSSNPSKIWNLILFVFIFSAISRYFIEVIMIGLASVFDPKSIDDIRANPGKDVLGTLGQLFSEGKTLAKITIGPIVEEIIYRGVLLNHLLRRQKALVALIITSLIFSAFHGNPLAAFLGGLMFGGIYLYTGRLIYCILAHATTNFVIIVLYTFPEKAFTFLAAGTINPISNALAFSAAVIWLLVFGSCYLKNSWKKLDSPFDIKFNSNKG